MFVYCSTSSLLVRVIHVLPKQNKFFEDFFVAVLIQEKGFFYWRLIEYQRQYWKYYCICIKENLLIKCLMLSAHTLLLQAQFGL